MKKFNLKLDKKSTIGCLLILFIPFLARILILGDALFLKQETTVWESFYNSIISEAPSIFIIFTLFYISFLPKIPQILSRLTRILAFILLIVYLSDLAVTSIFSTRLVFSDITTYSYYIINFFKQLQGKYFYGTLLTVIILSAFMILFTFTNSKITNKNHHYLITPILLVFFSNLLS